MGCVSSKDDEPPLVALCRQRCELIRATVDHRFALANAHAAYFAALERVGDALHRFVEAELMAAPQSPVLTLPPAEKIKVVKVDEVARSVDASGEDGCIVGKASSFDSISENSENSHLNFRSGSCSGEVSDVGEGGLSSVPSFGAETQVDGDESYRHAFVDPLYGIGGGEFSSIGSMSSINYPQYFSAPNLGYYYMKKSSTEPSTVYQNPYPEGSNSAYIRYGYGYGGTSEGSGVREEGKDVDIPPPPPVAVEGSGWDFFNPFNSYEDLMPGYGEELFGMGSIVSSPNSSEVREKEGIPGLEEETDRESGRELLKEKNVVDKGSSGRASSFNSSVGIAEEQEEVEKKVDPGVTDEKGVENIPGNTKMEDNGEVRKVRKKSVSFEEVKSPVTDETEPEKGSTLSTYGTRDVMEVVEEVKEQFKSASGCGKELSTILEVGKLKYKSRNKFLRVILSKILEPIILPAGSSSRAGAALWMDFDPGNLSATLEQLYEWEVKLHKEVKEEEKLRAIYEREWNELKALEEKGAEIDKIEATRASLRRLNGKIAIIIRSADHISERIHNLRDEKLRPQLIELIRGLVKMWKSILECHHKQFQAIVDSKSHDFSSKTGNSAAKVTIELEMEMLNWCSCFNDWIQMQKAYIETLNKWLVKWLLEEKEETPDGVAPFSPGRIGAPTVFVVSNDWYNIMHRISAEEVVDTMQTFAVNVHRLWEIQGEEQKQRLKAEYLSRDFTTRLSLLQTENGIQRTRESFQKKVSTRSGKHSELQGGNILALDDMRRRLEEEKAKHIKTMNQIHQATVNNLRSGLLPIFESLEKFSEVNLKGFEAVRIPDGNGVV